MFLARKVIKDVRLPLRSLLSSGGNKGGSAPGGGGSVDKRKKAQEDHYFRKLQEEQLKGIKQKPGVDGKDTKQNRDPKSPSKNTNKGNDT